MTMHYSRRRGPWGDVAHIGVESTAWGDCRVRSAPVLSPSPSSFSVAAESGYHLKSGAGIAAATESQRQPVRRIIRQSGATVIDKSKRWGRLIFSWFAGELHLGIGKAMDENRCSTPNDDKDADVQGIAENSPEAVDATGDETNGSAAPDDVTPENDYHEKASSDAGHGDDPEAPSVPEPTMKSEPTEPQSQDGAKVASASWIARGKELLAGKLRYLVPGAVALIVVLGALTYFFVHDWADATCLKPQICSICGATQGEPLGHDWAEADCRYPETCKRCGEERGAALGHDWADATCTQPRTCKRCQSTTGTALGHDMGEWVVDQGATCTEYGKQHRECRRCGEIENGVIQKTEHTPGEWVVVESPHLDENGDAVPGRRVRSCTACGQEIESETFSMSSEEIAAAYKDSCSSFTYDQVARDPDTYFGERAKFTGEVIQVLQEGNSYTLRVNITQVSYGWSDTIMVSYTSSAGESRILEDDVITLYGVMGGMYTYETIFGAEVTVPLLFAEYVDR